MESERLVIEHRYGIATKGTIAFSKGAFDAEVPALDLTVVVVRALDTSELEYKQLAGLVGSKPYGLIRSEPRQVRSFSHEALHERVVAELFGAECVCHAGMITYRTSPHKRTPPQKGAVVLLIDQWTIRVSNPLFVPHKIRCQNGIEQLRILTDQLALN